MSFSIIQKFGLTFMAKILVITVVTETFVSAIFKFRNTSDFLMAKISSSRNEE